MLRGRPLPNRTRNVAADVADDEGEGRSMMIMSILMRMSRRNTGNRWEIDRSIERQMYDRERVVVEKQRRIVFVLCPCLIGPAPIFCHWKQTFSRDCQVPTGSWTSVELNFEYFDFGRESIYPHLNSNENKWHKGLRVRREAFLFHRTDKFSCKFPRTIEMPSDVVVGKERHMDHHAKGRKKRNLLPSPSNQMLAFNLWIYVVSELWMVL